MVCFFVDPIQIPVFKPAGIHLKINKKNVSTLKSSFQSNSVTVKKAEEIPITTTTYTSSHFFFVNKNLPTERVSKTSLELEKWTIRGGGEYNYV